MGFNAAIVDFASPGSSGTVDVTSSGFGTPQAAMVWGTHAPDSTVPNRATDVNFYIGFWANDGSNTQDGLGFYVQDGVSTSNAQTRVGDGAGILADGENGVDNMAVVTTAITDGIRIQFNGGYSQRYFALLFSGAADFSLATFDNRGTSVDLSLGHEPHVAFCLTSAVPSIEGATLSDGGMGFGVLHFDGTTLAQLSTSWIAQDTLTTMDNAQVISDAEIGRALSYGTGNPVTASRPSADTLRLESTPYGSLCAVLAFELDDPDDFAIGLDREDLHTAPDDDGITQSVTIDTGWEPALVGLIGTRMTATNTWYSGFRSIGFCIGADDGTNGHCASWRTQDAQSTERAHSLNHDKIHALYKSNDDAVIDHQASLYSLDSDGFTLTWDDVQTDRPYFIWWAIKAATTTTITGTGALITQAPSIVGTGVREVAASGALSGQVSAIAGTAEREVTATGALSSPDSTIAGIGAAFTVITGAGAMSVDVSTLAGAGVRDITASGNVSADVSTVLGAGKKSVNASGALEVQAAAIVGTGITIGGIEGTAAFVAQDALISGYGFREIVASGSIVVDSSVITTPGFSSSTGALSVGLAGVSGAGTVTASNQWTDMTNTSSTWTDTIYSSTTWTDKTDESDTWTLQ